MSQNSKNDDGFKKPFTTSVFPPQSAGIQTIQINKAKEMIASTVQARNPSIRPNDPTTQPKKHIPITSVSSSFPSTRIPSATKISVPAKNHDIVECKNPQCFHCGRVIIPSPSSSLPINENPSISINDWEIYSQKRPILNSEEIDEWYDFLKFPIPEMIFGHNKIEIKNKTKDVNISFNTFDALKLVDSKGEFELLKVSYSKEWFKSRQNQPDDVKEIHKPFDWTYSTTYRGSLSDNLKLVKDPNIRLPIDKLSQQDPILFFDELVLYEDELGDNGISLLSCKIRVMPERLLILLRFFLRVDNVLFRIRDTRFYIEFKENLIIREYKEQESNYNDVVKKVSYLSGDPTSYLRDPNWLSTKLPTVKKTTEYIKL